MPTSPKPDTPKPDAPKPDAPKPDAPKPDAPKPADPFDVDFIVGSAIPASTALQAHARPRHERKPDQLAMDKVVVPLHDEWVKRDRPASWGKIPALTYYVPPERAAKLRELIRKACEFHGFRPKYGTDVIITEEIARKLRLAESHVGKVAVTFAALDKRELSAETRAKMSATRQAKKGKKSEPKT